mmetsp:Transcript_54345/g.118873  ORF Transcript_54345/g.118873 Transcript_54345/m.118873 type:complete len:241 (+) Transcript_54345:1220-1942(+)
MVAVGGVDDPWPAPWRSVRAARRGARGVTHGRCLSLLRRRGRCHMLLELPEDRERALLKDAQLRRRNIQRPVVTPDLRRHGLQRLLGGIEGRGGIFLRFLGGLEGLRGSQLCFLGGDEGGFGRGQGCCSLGLGRLALLQRGIQCCNALANLLIQLCHDHSVEGATDGWLLGQGGRDRHDHGLVEVELLQDRRKRSNRLLGLVLREATLRERLYEVRHGRLQRRLLVSCLQDVLVSRLLRR